MATQEPQLTDIGTRYQHYCDYRDGLEICIGIIRSRGLNSPADHERLIKFSIALEVVNSTIDSFAGLKDGRTEYRLYRQVDTIPTNPEAIPGGRGTPLKEPVKCPMCGDMPCNHRGFNDSDTR